MSAEGVGNRALDEVDAPCKRVGVGFGDHIGDRVDNIGVVACVAEEGVVASPAIEAVGQFVAGDGIRNGVADAVDGRACEY